VAAAIGLHDLVPVTVERTIEKTVAPPRQPYGQRNPTMIPNPERQKWRDAGRIGQGPPREIPDPNYKPPVAKVVKEKGSLQLFADNSKTAGALNAPMRYDGDRDLARASCFDILCNNTDRHNGNWMIQGDTGRPPRIINPEWHAWVAAGNHGPQPERVINDPNHKVGSPLKIVLIDHGLTFPTSEEGLRSWLMSEAVKRKLPVPQEVLSWDAGKIKSAMEKHGLEPAAVDVAMNRLTMLKFAAARNHTFNDLDANLNNQNW
jgi:hypothetical protein